MRFDKLAAFQIQSIAYKSHYENVPFEIPESWCWTTLGELFDIVSAKRVLQSDWQRTGIPFYRAREIVRLSYEGCVDNDLFITEEHYNNLKKSYGVPEPSDIMLSAVGTIGRAYVVRNNDVFYYKDASVLCLRNVFHLNSEFIKWILSSDLLQNQMYENSKGTTVDTITIEKANSYFLPLPPIDEQYRIVKLLCEWDAYINDINKNKEEVLNNIRTCKSKILDLAISGKLVPQDPNDEPAIELLKRINPDFEPCDNSHYENLPQGWTIVGLHSVAEIITGSTPSKLNAEYYNGDVPFYKPNDLDQGRHVRGASEYLSQQGKSISRSIPCNSIAVCCIGSIGKCGFIEKEGVTNQQINTIVPNDAIFPLYMYYFCNSSTFIDELKSLSSAVTISIVNKSKLSTIQIPVPPIAEQKRIISVIEKLYSHLDMITAEL